MIHGLTFDGRLVSGFWTHDCLAVSEPANNLPPPTRAVAMMALLGILLVGLFLVVAILLGGHWVRRLGKHRRGPSVPPDVAPVCQDSKADTTDDSQLAQSTHASDPDASIGTKDTSTKDDTKVDI